MQTLLESLKLKKTIGLLGIEIEVEGERLPRFDSIYWRPEHDPSLRGESVEYILKKPMEASSIIKAVEELNKKAEEAETKFNFSFRTSTHVHLNVQHNTHVELLNILYTYYLLENPMINYCGEERKCNRFCLRLEDAEGCTRWINDLFKGTEQAILAIPGDQIRYSALNLEAIKKYGSIEFRSMRGTVDKKEIKTWLDLILSIRGYALSKKTPLEIYNDFIDRGPEKFVNGVVGDLYKSIKYPELVDDVNRSFSLTIDFPFSFKNKDVKKEEEKPQLKIKVGDVNRAFLAAMEANPAPIPADWLAIERQGRMNAPVRRVKPVKIVFDEVDNPENDRDEE